jgi:hypothetical protein
MLTAYLLPNPWALQRVKEGNMPTVKVTVSENDRSRRLASLVVAIQRSLNSRSAHIGLP